MPPSALALLRQGAVAWQQVGTMDTRWGRTVTNKVLLMAGIAAAVVYVVGDLLSALLYDGYSYLDQAISELSAFGSPVRPLMVTVILIHDVLVVAFRVGVLPRLFPEKPSSWVGGLLIAIGVTGLPTHTVWPMSRHGGRVQRHDAHRPDGGVQRALDRVTPPSRIRGGSASMRLRRLQ